MVSFPGYSASSYIGALGHESHGADGGYQLKQDPRSLKLVLIFLLSPCLHVSSLEMLLSICVLSEATRPV